MPQLPIGFFLGADRFCDEALEGFPEKLPHPVDGDTDVVYADAEAGGYFGNFRLVWLRGEIRLESGVDGGLSGIHTRAPNK